jgi:hypothetical protein
MPLWINAKRDYKYEIKKPPRQNAAAIFFRLSQID